MPKYYFHVCDGGEYEDHHGLELADDGRAKLEAVRILAEVLRDQPELLLKAEGLEVSVADQRALTLFALDIRASTSAVSRRRSGS